MGKLALSVAVGDYDREDRFDSPVALHVILVASVGS